jgi:nucleoside-diphosphate-sugar epimerase
MDILVTGATGFIGFRLTEKLASLGHTVHVLSRDPGKTGMFRQEKIRFFTGDITNGESVRKAMKGCDHIYHLAACTEVWSKDRTVFQQQNVEGTRIVLDLAKELNVRKVLVASTAGVLGPSENGPVNESTARKTPYFTEYEKTKWMADQITKEYVKEGLFVVTVYPTRVFGPGPLNRSNSVTRLIKQYALGKWRIMPGSGKKTGNYVYIDNLVNGMIIAMEHGRTGEGYLLGGSNISYTEFFSTISDVIGKDHFMIRIPMAIALVVAAAMLLFARITGVPPLLTPAWIRKYLHDCSITNDKAITELGYVPGTFREGLEKTLEWLAVKSPE